MDLDILLIGKTGTGKSSTGNSILKRNLFQSEGSMTSVTKDIDVNYAKYKDYIIKVVDGPGVYDTELSDQEGAQQITEAMTKAIAASPQGYHAFLLVVRFGGRFTKEDMKTIQVLKAIFGEDFVKKFSVLVVTCGDMFNAEKKDVSSFEEWCFKQVGVFRDLLLECGNRVVLFDNSTKDEERKNRQLDKLIDIINRLCENSQRYTNDHFQMAAKKRLELIVESKEPIIREETMREASLIIQELDQIRLRDPKTQLRLLDQLLIRADSLVNSVIAEDKNTNALDSVIKHTNHIKKIVQEHITKAKQAQEIKEKEDELQNKMRIAREKSKEAEEAKLKSMIEALLNQRATIEMQMKQNVREVEKEHVSTNTNWLHYVKKGGKFLFTTILPSVLSFILFKRFK